MIVFICILYKTECTNIVQGQYKETYKVLLNTSFLSILSLYLNIKQDVFLPQSKHDTGWKKIK